MPVAVHNAVASGSRTVRDLVIGQQHWVQRQGGPARRATVLELRTDKKGLREAYVTFEGADKRLDSWVKEHEILEPIHDQLNGKDKANGKVGVKENTLGDSEKIEQEITHPKRRRLEVETNGESSSSRRVAESSPSAPSTPEREHAAMTRVRNFEDVRIGEYLIKTWYFSPYPMPIEDKPDSQNHSTPVPSSKKRKVETNGTSTAAQQVGSTSNGDRGAKGVMHKSASSRSVGEMLVAGIGKGGEGARGRLWVCDLCFKYMRTRDGWERHTGSCDMLTPPGRRVYQKGSYSIWEIDGAVAPLYCQNLSLFGKLFIDHKSVFFHVENFLFYVICDASTSRRDQVMAFFSKEKLSYDDYNLACIVTFPPCQNRGFGKLLIEFSYYLTKHPSTRPASLSPGTPERPLSDLGLKGYTAYWISTVLQVIRKLLEDAPPLNLLTTPGKSPAKREGRQMRDKRSSTAEGEVMIVDNDVGMVKIRDRTHRGQYAITTTMSDLAKACHLRIDDVGYTLAELGFLKHRRKISLSSDSPKRLRRNREQNHDGLDADERRVDGGTAEEGDLGEWKNVEVVVTRGMVEEIWDRWRVRDKGVLDEDCVLL